MEEQVNSQQDPVLVAELEQRQAEIEAKIVSVVIKLQLARTAKKFISIVTGKKPCKPSV